MKKMYKILGVMCLAALGFMPLRISAQTQPMLYGITYSGGTDNAGTIFKTDFSGNVSTVHTFLDPYSGAGSKDQLCEASNGKLYGLGWQSGSANTGVLFEYDPATAIYTKKLDLVGITGDFPQGSLIEANNGLLYGLTTGGGTNDMGVLFEYDPSTNAYTIKFNFDGAANGAAPAHSAYTKRNT